MTEPTDTAFLDNAARIAPAADSGRLGEAETRRLLDVFDSQLGSRHLDLAARWLRAQGKGFYTIGSAGHEGNAAVAASLRPTDPALLHYRSGAFYIQRARQVPRQHPLRDVMLGVAAAADEPMSGGRHKVFGNRELNVIPQTSTIASHLPRALGVAFAIDRSRKLGLECAWPSDSIAVCSFGDASANHSTAQGAFNAAAQSQHQGLPMPLLFVCEDNGFDHPYRHGDRETADARTSHQPVDRGRVRPRPRSTARYVYFSSPSRFTIRAICTKKATAVGSRPIRIWHRTKSRWFRSGPEGFMAPAMT